MVDSEECRSLLCSLLLLGRDILPWSMSLMCCTIRLMATDGENFINNDGLSNIWLLYGKF